MKRDRLTVFDESLGREVEIPSVFVVCPTCEGRGQVDHPAFSNGITSEEWNGPDWDDDSREMYLGGGYDVVCPDCRGKRVVLEPDFDRLTPEQDAAYRAEAEAAAEIRAEMAAERRAGA